MAQVIRGTAIAPFLKDVVSTLLTEPGTGVAIQDHLVAPRRARLTLTAFSITVLAANDYGGTKLCDLPFRNMLILGIETDLVVTKEGNANGLVSTIDIDMAIGSAVAAAVPLATTAIDIVETATLTADSLTVDFEKHTNDQATIVFPKKIADGATAALFLNLGVVGALVTANTSVLVSGTIDIFYIDLGKLV